MSKPVKQLIRKELVKRFDGLSSLAVIGFTGIDAITTHKIRGRLLQKEIKLTVVKNSLARQAFKEIGLPEAGKLLDGPCAIAFGEDPRKVGVINVIREMLDIRKETENLTVKAALLDGEVFGPERIDELSNYPTRDEAISRLIGCALSPGRNLSGILTGPGGTIANLVKAIQDKKQSEGNGQVEAA